MHEERALSCPARASIGLLSGAIFESFASMRERDVCLRTVSTQRLRTVHSRATFLQVLIECVASFALWVRGNGERSDKRERHSGFTHMPWLLHAQHARCATAQECVVLVVASFSSGAFHEPTT